MNKLEKIKELKKLIKANKIDKKESLEKLKEIITTSNLEVREIKELETFYLKVEKNYQLKAKIENLSQSIKNNTLENIELKRILLLDSTEMLKNKESIINLLTK